MISAIARAREQVAGDCARQHGGRAGAGGLDHTAGQEIGQVGGEATPRAAGKEHGKPDQHRPTAAKTVGDRPDHELAECKYRKEDGDGGSHRRTGDVQRGGHLRQRRQQDIGRQRPGGGEPGQNRDL
jgi:hypothetical protein